MKSGAVKTQTTMHMPMLAIFGVFIFVMVANAHAEGWDYRQHTQIRWRDYNPAAFAEARAKNKPVYVLIYANWCHWCRKFETETLETKSIRQILQTQFIPVAIDQAAQPELAKRLGARLVPMNFVLTEDNKRLLRFHGFLKQQELADALTHTLQAWRKGEITGEEFGDESTCCATQ